MSPHRIIKRIRHAAPLKERPPSIPISRPRGAKAAGLRYERSLAKHLPAGAHGVWFEFADENGRGYCQTDHLYSFLPDFIAIIEVKYTLVLDAYSKLRDFYIPIVSTAMKCPAVGIIVARNLIPGLSQVFIDLPSAAYASYAADYPTVLHWRGQNLLAPILGTTPIDTNKQYAKRDIVGASAPSPPPSRSVIYGNPKSSLTLSLDPNPYGVSGVSNDSQT